MIKFAQVSKAYLGGRPALQNISFTMARGSMAFLIGHSGAGKSTLLKLINGVERLNAGKIWFDGYDISRLPKREIPFLRRQIGVIFQDHPLLMEQTVFANVALPLIINGESDSVIYRQTMATLDRVGLLEKADRLPIELSGGEQQRVGIARAVVNHPKVLLADEPTGNLDDKLAADIFHLLETFNQSGITVLMATHDLSRIKRHPYRILALDQGHLIEDTRNAPYTED